MAYLSKRTGEEVDALLDKVEREDFPDINTEDYYPNMSVGFADNLVGRGDVKDADFMFRASAAHDNIADDTARVKRIKGNSVVWNQQVNVVNAVALTPASASVTVVGNSITVTSNVSASAGDNVSVKIPNVVVPVGHKVLLTYEITTTAQGITKCHTEGVVESYSSPSFNDITNTSTNLFLKADGSVEVGDTCTFSNIHLFDLTQMFTSGNEPTTVEDFYARIPSGIDVNAYKEREIISMHTKAIRTIGFNQWDEQWVNGRADANVQNGLRCADYIRVIPNTTYYLNNGGYVAVNGVVRYFDKDKNFLGYLSLDSTRLFATPQNCMYIIFYIPTDNPVTQYNNDVCLNLSHTGWRNGQYAPYTPFTRELSIIKKYFPNGMRSDGNAFDSIEWDSSKQKWIAVQNVGVRAYEESDDTNTAVITDGTNTHYALAEPIVTEIEEENINFDYYVEDFGTEEALSGVPSASFRADVVYTPNAVDDIRALLVRVSALETDVQTIQASIQASETME